MNNKVTFSVMNMQMTVLFSDTPATGFDTTINLVELEGTFSITGVTGFNKDSVALKQSLQFIVREASSKLGYLPKRLYLKFLED